MQPDVAAANPVRRDRLLSSILDTEGVVAIEAPRGFGKSCLAAQLLDTDHGFDASTEPVEHLHDAWKAAGRPNTLVLDDAGPEQPRGELLSDLTAARIVLLSRDLPTLQQAPDLRLTADDLSFDLSEVERLAISRRHPAAELLAHFLLSHTGGWPRHVAEAISVLASGPTPAAQYADFLAAQPEIRSLVSDTIDSLEPDTHGALEQPAHFESFPEEAVGALVGGAAHRRLRSAGFPLVPAEDGWVSMVPLIRAALASEAELTADAIDTLVPILVARGGVFLTSKALLSAGAAAAAADVVASVPAPYLDTVSQRDALALFRVMSAAGVERSELLLRKARVHRNLAELDEQVRAVDDAVERAEAAGDEAALIAARSEQLYLAAPSLDRRTLTERLDDLRRQARELEGSPSVVVRCREVEAMALAHSHDLADVVASVDLLESVAVEWEHLGDRAQAAITRRVLAASALNHLGRYDAAIDALQRAKSLLPDNMFSRALTCELLARFHALVGDIPAHEAARREATAFAGAVQLSWLTGYLHWAAMLSSAMIGDRSAAAWHQVDARANLGQLLQRETGLLFHCESAAAFAILGDAERATANLEAARGRRSENRLEVALAELIVEARTGDAEAAGTMARTLLDDPAVPTGRRWRVMIELVAAGMRMHPIPDLTLVHRRLDEETEALGLTAARRLLLPNSSSMDPGVDRPDIVVEMLGAFAVRVAGATVDPPTGQVGTLLKVLAIRGGPMAVEVIIDWLWPEADLSLGRRRLKNVVRRLRVSLGDHALVRTESTIELTDAVTVDAANFEREAGRAAEMAAQNDPLALTTAINALGLYTGDLLPGDSYSSWAASERDRLRSLAVSTLEYAIGVATQGDLPVSWLYETGVRLRVESERVFVNIAVLAVSSGSEETARASLARAREAADELGVELTGVAGLEDLLDQDARDGGR